MRGSQKSLAQLEMGWLWHIFALKILYFSVREFNTFMAKIAEQYQLQITQLSDQASLLRGWSSDTLLRSTFCFSTIRSILPNFLKNSYMSDWLKLKLSGIAMRRIPTDSLQFFSNLQMYRQTDPLFSTRAFLRPLKSSSGRSEESSYSEEELLLSESPLRLCELFRFIDYIHNPTLIKNIHFAMTAKDEEIDPSIYQYDQIYDQIKGKEPKDQGRDRSRSRSREKKKKLEEKPKHSKYIGRMKQVMADRHKDHEAAYEKKIVRDNEKLGVNEEMVFVTESYLQKKEEEREAAKKKKMEQEKNEKQAPEKGSYVDFKKKMLEQQLRRK